MKNILIILTLIFITISCNRSFEKDEALSVNKISDKILTPKKFTKPKFKIGDKVICINDGLIRNQKPEDINTIPSLIYKKKVYKVLDITQCKICYSYAIDVGLINHNDGFTQCLDHYGFNGRKTHWASEERFELYKSNPDDENETKTDKGK